MNNTPDTYAKIRDPKQGELIPLEDGSYLESDTFAGIYIPCSIPDERDGKEFNLRLIIDNPFTGGIVYANSIDFTFHREDEVERSLSKKKGSLK